MKILILILSYNSPPFDTLMRVQQETFDSVEVEGVRTVYYHGGSTVGRPVVYTNMDEFKSWYRVEFPCTDSYYFMTEKFKEALKFIEKEDINDFDLIFRTNSSSYVNKPALIEFAKTLPREKLYAGWEIEGNAGYNVVSGAGIWLSRDTAKILMEEIDPKREREEDCLIAEILAHHSIPIIDDKSRYDVNGNIEYVPTDLYHYRFKHGGDRLIDAHNMILLHNKIISQ